MAGYQEYKQTLLITHNKITGYILKSKPGYSLLLLRNIGCETQLKLFFMKKSIICNLLIFYKSKMLRNAATHNQSKRDNFLKFGFPRNIHKP